MRLFTLSTLALSASVLAGPVAQLSDFELTDQDAKVRTYRFPKDRVTVMTVADHKGSDQLPVWIQRLHDRFGKRIDIDGIADVSMIPRPFHGIFREAFRKKLTYSVMLDWGGSVVKKFGHSKGVANLYVIARDGRILRHMAGPYNEESAQVLYGVIERAMDSPAPK